MNIGEGHAGTTQRSLDAYFLAALSCGLIYLNTELDYFVQIHSNVIICMST